MIGTSHSEKRVDVGDLENKVGINSSDKTVDRHSHPEETGTKGGSGYDGAEGDKQNITKWKKDNPGKKEPVYMVYHSYTKTFYQYTEDNPSFVVDSSSK